MDIRVQDREQFGILINRKNLRNSLDEIGAEHSFNVIAGSTVVKRELSYFSHLAVRGDCGIFSENGTDKAGRMMPRYLFNHYKLGKSELLLMSDVSGTSFDGAISGQWIGAGEGPQV